MNIQGDALSEIGERVDELYLLNQQAQSRLEQSQQQQISFTKGCDILFEKLERKVKRMETATNKSHRVAKQLEVDVLLSQKRVVQSFRFSLAAITLVLLLAVCAWGVLYYYEAQVARARTLLKHTRVELQGKPIILSSNMTGDKGDYVLIDEGEIVELSDKNIIDGVYAKLRYA